MNDLRNDTTDRSPACLDRPVLVTGTPRSGKTCVSWILERAEEFALANEPLMNWDPGLTGMKDDRLTADHATPRIRARIVKGCANVVRRANRRRYLEDLSYHALRIPFVHRVLPDAKIVHVIRNPRGAIPEMLYGWTQNDSVARAVLRRRQHIHLRSLPRMVAQFARNYVRSRVSGSRASWGPRVPGLTEFAASHSVAEVAAFQWRMMVTIAREDLADLPQDQVLEVRYESLIEQPREQILRMAAFCEIDDPQPSLDYAASFLDPNYEFEKVVEPTREDWAAIEEQIGELCETLGY